MRPECLYTDGGVIQKNPSPIAGTWAFLHVHEDEPVLSVSGVVLPADVGLPTVSNNATEFFAMLAAVEALPEGWTGIIYTDSWVTLCRFRNPAKTKMVGIPAAWVERAKAAVARFDKITPPKFVLLGGHPTKADLAQGCRVKDGLPVSRHNVACDKMCTAAGKRHLEMFP